MGPVPPSLRSPPPHRPPGWRGAGTSESRSSKGWTPTPTAIVQAGLRRADNLPRAPGFGPAHGPSADGVGRRPHFAGVAPFGGIGATLGESDFRTGVEPDAWTGAAVARGLVRFSTPIVARPLTSNRVTSESPRACDGWNCRMNRNARNQTIAWSTVHAMLEVNRVSNDGRSHVASRAKMNEAVAALTPTYGVTSS